MVLPLDFLRDIMGLDPVAHPTDFTLAQSGIQSRSVKKGEMLVREGELSSKIFYVKKGVLRSYSLDEKGKEHIFVFAPEGWIVSDSEAIALDAPSNLFIDAVEASEIEVIDKLILQNVMITSQATEKIIMNLMKRISVLQKRVIMLMSFSALQRYTDFIKTYPDIIQRVPQRMVASYLGITPEALSKVRGTLARSNKK